MPVASICHGPWTIIETGAARGSVMKVFSEVVRRFTALRLHDFTRRPGCDDRAALVARSRPHVDHPIALGNDLHIVLNHHNRVSGFNESVQLRLQPFHVGRMKTGRRLIENVKGVSMLSALKLSGELDALRLSSGQLRCGLAKLQISQPDITQDFQGALNSWLIGEKVDAFVALPGGFGTFEELFEVLAWHTLKLHAKPILLLNTNGFYDKLLVFLDHCVAEGMLKPKNREILLTATTVEEALTLLEICASRRPYPLQGPH